MIREEEIQEYALNYAEKIDYDLWLDTEHPKSYAKMLVLATVEDSVKWADEHPAQSITNLQAEIITLKTELESACEQLKMNAEDLYRLSHPWISVKERLPKTGDDIIYLMNSGTPGRQDHYTKWFEEWLVMNTTHWMPTQIPQKGGEV